MRNVLIHSCVWMIWGLICSSLPHTQVHGEDGPAESGKALTADDILDRVRQTLMEAQVDVPVMTYLRHTVISDLDTQGKTKEITRKTYRAYTDGRDQLLLEVDGRPATQKEIEKDRAHNLDRQQKYLHRQADEEGGQQDDLMVKNMDLFRRKFSVRLGEEARIQDRECFVLEFTPDLDVALDNRFVDRLMNAVRSKVWVDKKAFRIARIDTQLVEPVTFLGGLAGVLREIKIKVDQKQLAPDLWVDDEVRAFFDVRVFLKTFRFQLKSASSNFEPVESEEHSTE